MEPLDAWPQANAFDGQDLLPAPQPRRQDRAAVHGPPVDNHGAGAALGAVAAEVGAGDPQLATHRRPEALAHVHQDLARHPVEVDCDPPHRARQLRGRRRYRWLGGRWLRLDRRWWGGRWRRRWWHGDGRATWRGLNRLWRGHSLRAGGQRDTARDDGRTRHADACAREEVTSRDDRSRALCSATVRFSR